jgi:hypothetical protein
MAAARLVCPEKSIPLEPGGRVRITPGDNKTNNTAKQSNFILLSLERKKQITIYQLFMY